MEHGLRLHWYVVVAISMESYALLHGSEKNCHNTNKKFRQLENLPSAGF